MFQRTIKYLLLSLLPCTLVYAKDSISDWLEQMGCDEILSTYLENELDYGDRKEKIRAAKQLANLYAFMLSSVDQEGDKELLQRAISLFDRIPESGTTDLRVQLYRATYIAAEQILERYRLRISDKEEAALAIEQLKKVADDLISLRKNLLRSMQGSQSKQVVKKEQLILVTSFLAWSKYYIAWFENSKTDAEISASLFAAILLGDRAHLQSVSIGLKEHEFGARAILGIALCKSILEAPEGPEPWFAELEGQTTWDSVRDIVPLWRFYLHIDNLDWDNVQLDIQNNIAIDPTLLFRVSAVHSLEYPSNPIANSIAALSLARLIEYEQLAIVNDIVNKYGNSSLPRNGFIAQYLEGTNVFQAVKEIYPSDKPAKDELIQKRFDHASVIFKNALESSDAINYKNLHNECHFMEGLSLYYSSQFQEAANSFLKSSENNEKERSIWMAIVSLDFIRSPSEKNAALLDELTGLYIHKWPDNPHSTQLIVHRVDSEIASPELVEDLLAVLHTDPYFEDAQRKASRLLYQLWQNADEFQRPDIGNRYVSVSIQLMIADDRLIDDSHANEVSAIRAMRILEIALHPDVQRLIAASRAISVLEHIEQRPYYSLDTFRNQITYRTIHLLVLKGHLSEATILLIQMIQTEPENIWTTLAAKNVWSYISTKVNFIEPEILYPIGSHILNTIDNVKYGSKEYLSIASKTAQSAFDLFLTNNDEVIGLEALEISRIIVSQHPKYVQLLILNAELENALGDSDISSERWKTIASGSKSGSTQWLQARYNIIRKLAESAPKESLVILNQHQILYPQYGMEPYGSKLRMLHHQLKGSVDGN